MVSKEILRERCLLLPVEYNRGSCEDAIDKRLNEYEKLLREYSVDERIIKSTDIYRNHINEMYHEYYLGHQNKAYAIFSKAFLKQTQNYNEMFTSILPKGSLYRARINDTTDDFKDEEMFHINYKQRGKVKPERFSLSGVPCLYLGGSSYVCWLELNRPQFDQFQVALISQQYKEKDLKVIDLCKYPLIFYKELKEEEKENSSEQQEEKILKYLQWWPIMATCLIAVKNQVDYFKPEYIFSEFLLQYLLEETTVNDYIGIKYMSIKAGKVSKKQYESEPKLYTNYVIPVRSFEGTKEGFCTILTKEFCVTRNCSGKELQVLTDFSKPKGLTWQLLDDLDRNKDQYKGQVALYGSNGKPYLYSETIFSRIEDVLNGKINAIEDN